MNGHGELPECVHFVKRHLQALCARLDKYAAYGSSIANEILAMEEQSR